MGYQVRPRTSRGFGRRPDRAKLKAKADRRRSTESRTFAEESVCASKEALDRTLNSLRHLGEQRFPLPPFYEHFGRWFSSLQAVLSEFESNSSVMVDDQFRRECSEIITTLELALEQKRLKEISFEESMRKINQNLRDARTILAQTEQKYATEMRKLVKQEELEVKPVAGKVGKLREELNRVVRSKPGFLGIFRKSSAQKEVEATQKLDSTKQERERIEQSFTAEGKRLKDEYRQKRQKVLEQIARLQSEIEGFGTDASINDVVEIRLDACRNLTGALEKLLARSKPTPENGSPS